MAARFLNDGRLKLDDGQTLDRGPDWLTRSAATELSKTANIIFYRFYPESEVITPQSERVASLLERVDPDAREIGATLYSGSAFTVLTLEEMH